MVENCDVGCLCCKFGFFSIIFYIDRGGYCFGEFIGVLVVISNNLNNEIIGLEF